jgi:hypothetical protein
MLVGGRAVVAHLSRLVPRPKGGVVIRYPAGMRAITAPRFGDWGRFLLLALCLVAPAAMANQIIAAGGRTILVNGLVNLACTDLTVGGVLDTGTGTYVNVSNVTVGPSGVIQGAGTIRYSGKLSVNGTIQASVKLVVNPPSNAACPGPPPAIAAIVNPAPTLSNSMLVALATLMLLLALFALRGQPAPRRSSEANGGNK